MSANEVTMHVLHRTRPERCPNPKCNHSLKTEGLDYTRILGSNKGGEVHVNKDRIIECANPRCRNQTFQLVIEEWRLTRKEDAAKLLATGEYWNLKTFRILRDYASDVRTIFVDLARAATETPRFSESGKLLPSASDPLDLRMARYPLTGVEGGR